jgi:hypothetical protein
VHLVAATVVRLIRTLAHGDLFRGGGGHVTRRSGPTPHAPDPGTGGNRAAPVPAFRLAPPTHARRRFHGRAAPVDAGVPGAPERRSLPGDRPTVRGGARQGQTRDLPGTNGLGTAAGSLWRNPCPRRRPLVTFAPSGVPHRRRFHQVLRGM